MKKIVREPLLHFVLLGCALFATYALVSDESSDDEKIEISAGEVAAMVEAFARTGRPPTPVEVEGLIRDRVREEIYCREAMALGLHQDDTIIRRRLRQKMEFIAEDFAATAEPTEAELADYLAKHPAQFESGRRFTFRQVFLNSEKRGDRLEADAAALLTRLKQEAANAETDALGDSSLLPEEFTDEPQRAVESQFGPEFAIELARVKPGEWSGPFQSSYGTHVVFVISRTEGRVAALDEVRDQVKRELMNERRLAANQRLFDGLLAKYRVSVQQPAPEAAPPVKATAMNR